jgi:hypothetical protein
LLNITIYNCHCLTRYFFEKNYNLRSELIMRKLLVISAVVALGLSWVVLARALPEELPPIQPITASPSDRGIYLGIGGGYRMTYWDSLDGYVAKDDFKMVHLVMQ